MTKIRFVLPRGGYSVRSLLAAGITAAALAGCGGPPDTYENVAKLRDAVIAAGVDCPSDFTTGVLPGRQDLSCTSNFLGGNLDIYVNPDDPTMHGDRQWADLYHEPYVYGRGWLVIDGTKNGASDMSKVHDKLGGTLVSTGPVSSGSANNTASADATASANAAGSHATASANAGSASTAPNAAASARASGPWTQSAFCADVWNVTDTLYSLDQAAWHAAAGNGTAPSASEWVKAYANVQRLDAEAPSVAGHGGSTVKSTVDQLAHDVGVIAQNGREQGTPGSLQTLIVRVIADGDQLKCPGPKK